MGIHLCAIIPNAIEKILGVPGNAFECKAYRKLMPLVWVDPIDDC